MSTRTVAARPCAAAVCGAVAAFALIGASACLAPGGRTAWEGDASPVACAGAQEASDEALYGLLDADQGILPVGLSEDDATYTTVECLASADEALDGTLVTFFGEVVGEPVNASSDGYRWVVVQDSSDGSTSSIEVLMTDEQVAQIENFGSYQVRGTVLRVTGIYRVADESQTGSLDVTACSVSVVDAGGRVEEPADLRLLWVGLGLVAVGLALTALNVYLKRRSRS